MGKLLKKVISWIITVVMVIGLMNGLVFVKEVKASLAPYGIIKGGNEGAPLKFILVLVIIFIHVLSLWKIFEKASEPGWVALVPLLNLWVLYKISWDNGWFCFLNLIVIIPFIGWMAVWILYAITMYKLADNFLKSGAFTVGLILLPGIFMPILAFSDAEYFFVDDYLDKKKKSESSTKNNRNRDS